MNFANIWLGIRAEAHAAIIERLQWDDSTEYTGPVTDREHRLFRYMADQTNIQRMFKTNTVAGKKWTLWNLSFTSKLTKVKIELDKLLSDRPDHITVAGAWRWDGSQFGTDHVYSTRTVTRTWSVRNPDYQPDEELPDFDDGQRLSVTGDVEEEFVSGMEGTPMYPIPKRALLKFMPDRVDEDGLVIGPATELSDVNLSYGQAPRSFF